MDSIFFWQDVACFVKNGTQHNIVTFRFVKSSKHKFCKVLQHEIDNIKYVMYFPEKLVQTWLKPELIFLVILGSCKIFELSKFDHHTIYITTLFQKCLQASIIIIHIYVYSRWHLLWSSTLRALNNYPCTYTHAHAHTLWHTHAHTHTHTHWLTHIRTHTQTKWTFTLLVPTLIDAAFITL